MDLTNRVLWPQAPYKGLNYYKAADWPLFAERDKDVEECAELLGYSTTKVLLLHGRTGTGKSSFLRAGVLPYIAGVDPPYVWVKAEESETEPFLVRSTDDPISRLAAAIRMAIGNPLDLCGLTEPQRNELKSFIWDEQLSRKELSKRVYVALRKISGSLKGTLTLVIDQAEEVLTLSNGGDELGKKAYFFEFIERLCLEPIDVKLIVVLRTEYYGAFTDWFRITPASVLSNENYGLIAFMLHGLRDHSHLVDAIVRPTLKSGIAKNGIVLMPPPHSVYRFEYEAGLPELITEDIFQHCGESSVLPVMQIVTNDLFNSVVRTQGRAIISRADYLTIGGVEGALDRFIQESIRGVLRKRHRHSVSEDSISRWKSLIALLVTRQEGGSLTTTLMPISSLEKVGVENGIEDNIAECLAEMASENIRLLRSVTLRVQGDDNKAIFYSLGHDSLAASLFQWREVGDKLAAERARLRRLQYILVAGVALCVVALAGGVYAHFSFKYAALKTLNDTIDEDASTSAGKRLQLAAFALRNTDTIADRIMGPLFMDSTTFERKLRDLVNRSPKVMITAGAGGLNADKTALAVLESNDKVEVIDLKSGLSAKELGGGAGLRERGRGGEASYSLTDAVGFVSDSEIPVRSKYGIVTAYTKSGEVNKELDKIVEPGNKPFAVDFAGEIMHINYFEPGRLHLLDVLYDNQGKEFVPIKTMDIQYFSPLFPTYSDFSEAFAVINRNTPLISDTSKSTEVFSSLEAGTRGDDSGTKRVATLRNSDEEAAKGDFAAQLGPRSFVRALAFANGDRAIVVRETKEQFRLFPLPRPTDGRDDSFVIEVPEGIRDQAPVRQPWRLTRPILAATSDRGIWYIAWLCSKGIIAMESRKNDAQKDFPPMEPMRPWPLFPSIPRMEFGIKLAFSNDGSYLTLIAQREPGVVDIRSWDFSVDRLTQVNGLKPHDLIAEACRIAAQESEGDDRLSDSTMAVWRSIGSVQPCGSKK
jgi:hypothetical protein